MRGRYAYFLGCTIPYRENNYDLSTRKAMEKLEIELVDLPGAGCCGVPYEEVDEFKWLCLAARVLSMAEQRGLDLMVICNGCAGSLVRANNRLRHDDLLLQKVNCVLGAVGREYRGTVRVKHLVRVLYEDVGVEAIRSLVQRPLSLKAGTFYGCHLLRPYSEMRFEYQTSAESLDRLVEATGAESVDYYEKEQCCGRNCRSFESALCESTGTALASQKIVNALDAGCESLVLVCPNCHVALDFNQPAFENVWKREFQLPVLYYSQLLGLALGCSAEEVGLKQNRIKVKPELLAAQGAAV